MRHSTLQGKSQLRTCRRATGQEGHARGVGGRRRWCGGRPRGRCCLFPPPRRRTGRGRDWVGRRRRRRWRGQVDVQWGRRPGGVAGREPRSPAEGKRAQDQGPVPADGAVAADLEVGPAQFVFDLLVALLHPVAQPVQAHHLSEIGGRKRRLRCPWPAGSGQVRRQIPSGEGWQRGRVGGRHHQARSRRPPPAPTGPWSA